MFLYLTTSISRSKLLNANVNQPKSQSLEGFEDVVAADDELVVFSDTSSLPAPPSSSTNHVRYAGGGWGGFEDEAAYLCTVDASGAEKGARGQFEEEMLCSQVQVLLVASFSSVLLVQVGGAPRTHVLAGLLRADLADDKVSNDKVSNYKAGFKEALGALTWSFSSPVVFSGPRSPAPAEPRVGADGGERLRDAAWAAGRPEGSDAASRPSCPKRAQGGLPKLLLEDVHLVLTQRFKQFELRFKDELIRVLWTAVLKKREKKVADI